MRPGPRSLSNLKPWPSPAGGQPKCCKVAPELPILYVVFSKSASVRPQASSTSKSEAESASACANYVAFPPRSCSSLLLCPFAKKRRDAAIDSVQQALQQATIDSVRSQASERTRNNGSKCADTARVHFRCRRSQEAKRHRGRRLILDLAHGERHVAVHQSF